MAQFQPLAFEEGQPLTVTLVIGSSVSKVEDVAVADLQETGVMVQYPDKNDPTVTRRTLYPWPHVVSVSQSIQEA